MRSIFMIANGSKAIAELCNSLSGGPLDCYTADRNQSIIEQLTRQSPSLVLVALDDYPGIMELVHQIKQEHPVPIMALATRETIDNIDIDLPIDDILISPYDLRELVFRTNRLLKKSGVGENAGQIRYDNLVIDQDKCEVTLGGKVLMLTFREYELLKFLAGNAGRVFTRETLLNKVWGYDYYGGDRTVDVHIRRLRSKIEDSGHTFIETVRNIGYRFRINY